MQILLKTLSILFWTGYGAFIILSFVISASSSKRSNLPFQSFIVQTASMEPTIMTGDVIFIKPQEKYALQDIITFTNDENQTITHRIIASNVSTDKTTFTTQGDNNTTEDPKQVATQQILGKFQAKIPKAGYVLVNAQKPTNLFLLIAIPLAVIIGGEVFKKKDEKHAQK